MDGILGVGPLELIVIVVLALVILGPERLPGTIREVVKFIRQVRAVGTELMSQFSEELNLLDDFNPKKILEDVVGLEEDEKFDAKSMLGIDKDDLTLGIDKPKKTTSAKKSSAKKSPASSAVASTAPHKNKRTKPALGETDPEETSAVDAVVVKSESGSDSDGSDNTDSENDGSDNGSSDSKTSDSVGSKPTDSQPTDSKPAGSKSAVSAQEKPQPDKPSESVIAQVETEAEAGLIEEPIIENRIAPPSMTTAQSLVAGKAHQSNPVQSNPVTTESVVEAVSEVVSEEVTESVAAVNLPEKVTSEALTEEIADTEDVEEV